MYTDSYVYLIYTEDFYKDLIDNPNLMTHMDTSNFPHNHPCRSDVRKKVPGMFKDEVETKTIREFVALRAKSYAYNVEGIESVRAKGIRKHVVDHHLTFDDHKRCLFKNKDDDDVDDVDGRDPRVIAKNCGRRVIEQIHRDVNSADQNLIASSTSTDICLKPSYPTYTPYRQNVSIRSFQHRLKTIKTMKLALSRADDKRYIRPDGIHTYAHGHYRI